MAVIALTMGSGCGNGESAQDACATVTCGHGVCAVGVDGAALCACDRGYYAEGLACLSNFGGGPSDGGVDGMPATVLVPSTSMPKDIRLGGIAVDSTHIYWSENVLPSISTSATFHARRIPLGGGAVEVLGDQGGPATAAAVDDNDFFFCRADGIFAFPKAGGAIRLVSAATDACKRRGGSGAEVASLVRSGDQVYWIEGFKTLRRAPSAGGAAETVATASGLGTTFFSFTIAGSQIFTAELQQILAMGTNGGGVTPLATGMGLDNVTVVGDQLFYSENGEFIRSMPLGGGPSSIVAYTASGVGHFAVDGAGMWIADNKGTAKLYHMAGPGLLPAPVANGGWSCSVQLAPGLVVWATETSIVTLPR